MKLHIAVAVLVVTVIAGGLGCASLPKKASGPVFAATQVPAGKAVVYFFRTDKFVMSANTIFMSIPKSANNCFGMVTAGYYPWITDPGKQTVMFAARDGEKDYTLELKAGDTRYVKVDFSDDFAPQSFYKEIPAAEAVPEISKYRMIEKCN